MIAYSLHNDDVFVFNAILFKLHFLESNSTFDEYYLRFTTGFQSLKVDIFVDWRRKSLTRSVRFIENLHVIMNRSNKEVRMREK